MSSPYYRFGSSPRRYAAQWSGAPGGIMPGTRSATRRSLGSLASDGFGSLGVLILEESGAPAAHHFPALADWPAIRPAGPEPLDPGEAPMGLFEGVLSRNETRLLVVGAAGAALWYFVLRKKARRRRRRRRT
jgi:hypothetical protein